MRRPTLDEAIAHITNSHTARYQRECIRYWREKYGDDFADEVRRAAAKRLRGKAAVPDPGNPVARAGA